MKGPVRPYLSVHNCSKGNAKSGLLKTKPLPFPPSVNAATVCSFEEGFVLFKLDDYPVLGSGPGSDKTVSQDLAP